LQRVDSAHQAGSTVLNRTVGGVVVALGSSNRPKERGMPEFLEPSFMWPTWPATMLVIVCCTYWLMVIVGAVTVDALHIDFHHVHFDTGIDGSLLDLGFVPLRFLNLGRVPLMFWLSIFGLSAWVVSRVILTNFEHMEPHREFVFATDSLAIVRDFVIATVITKILTQPLCGKFDVVEPIGSKDLLGKTCRITTNEATDKRGEASFATGAAPLVLHVRAAEGTLNKGDFAEIVDYSPEENVYFVKRMEQEV